MPSDNFARRAPRALTLVEVVIGSALMLIVFLAIFGAFQLSLALIFSTKAATGATALINQKIEYIRGLNYDAVGTVGGIPSGNLPQTETQTLNGIPYTIATLVQYVDDPSDGTGSADSNGITADYKNVRVQASWAIRGTLHSSYAETQIAPKGIETLSSGGTLLINVFNISAAPVSGAAVRITNSTVSPAVDVTVTTGASGSVSFPGAPPGSGYHVAVSEAGYGSAQTYAVSQSNPNPNPGDVAVQNKKTTTLSLQIDPLGSLTVSTFSPAGAAAFSDTFNDQTALSATSSATVSGGSLRLSGSAGSYPASGSAQSTVISPAYLASWTSASWTASTSAQVSAKVSVYYWNGTAYVLVPDTNLPGNSAGFTSSPVSLATLSTGTYTRLELGAALASANSSWTPEIKDWSVSYVAGPTPKPSVPFTVRGAKVIGTSAGGTPIYKRDETDTTGAQGTWILDPSAEADGYIIGMPSNSSYAIQEQCPSSVSVAPSANVGVSVTVVNATTNSLRVVASGNGTPLPNATVTLSGAGTGNGTTSSCGQAYFGGIASGTYTVTISAAGYQPYTDPNVAVSGQTVYSAALTQ